MQISIAIEGSWVPHGGPTANAQISLDLKTSQSLLCRMGTAKQSRKLDNSFKVRVYRHLKCREGTQKKEASPHLVVSGGGDAIEKSNEQTVFCL